MMNVFTCGEEISESIVVVLKSITHLNQHLTTLRYTKADLKISFYVHLHIKITP